MSGQTLADRLTAAKHSLAGQGLAKSVCKATTEEVIGPKKKHLDYLLACTNEPNVSIPQMANLLIERTTNGSWVVVFKALISVHHLMCYGNERFTQYLASSNCAFQLSNFLDKTGTAGYDMSTYIRRYAKYLNEEALSYRTVAFDFCKVKRGKEDGTLRTMPTEKLLKTLPVLQNQVDALVEFDCSAGELTNGVINTAFMLLFRDLIRLFACYNDGIIHLLEEYFEMNKKQCREALDIYKKFLTRMDRVSEFLKTAENVGVDKADIPDLSKAPSSLLDALESHLASLEGRKYVPQANGVNGTGNFDDDSVRMRALADEEAALQAIKEKHDKQTNPFLASPSAEAAPSPFAMASASNTTTAASTGNDILDLLEAPGMSAGDASSNLSTKPSDDLLQLGANPFADILSSASSSSATSAGFGAVSNPGMNNFGMGMGHQQQQQQQPSLGIFGGGPATGPNSMVNPDSIWSTPSGSDPSASSWSSPNMGTGNNVFATDAGFAAAFGGTGLGSASSFDAFGQMLQPISTANINNNNSMGRSAGFPGGAGATPAVSTGAGGAGKQQKSLFSGDLDSTLASLADSLSMSGGGGAKGWSSPAKQPMVTPGANWAAAGTGPPRPNNAMGGMGMGGMNMNMGAVPTSSGASMGGPFGAPAHQQTTSNTGNLLGGSYDPFGAL